MTEAIDSGIRETFLAGQLVIVARRPSVSHGGQAQATEPEERHCVTYAYSVHGEKFARPCFCMRIAAQDMSYKKYKRT